jgi:uncharacterized protein (DUF58 family)
MSSPRWPAPSRWTRSSERPVFLFRKKKPPAPAAPPEALFGPEFVALLDRLSLLARQRVHGLLRAEHRSRAHGSGLEIADHREYVAGDDLRRVDWNVAARTGRLMIRRFEEEEDLYLYLAVDVSGSMAAGDPVLRRRALRLAAALAYIGLVRLDRVGISLVDTRARARLGPLRGKGQVHRVLRFLEEAAPGEGTDLGASLMEVARLAPRRGLVVVLSDCYDEAGLLRGCRLLRHDGFDAAVVRLVDLRPPPAPGDLRVIDVESGRRADVTLTREAARRLEEAKRRLSTRLRQGCHAMEVSYQERPIQEPIAESVLRALREGSLIEQHVATARSGAWA